MNYLITIIRKVNVNILGINGDIFRPYTNLNAIRIQSHAQNEYSV